MPLKPDDSVRVVLPPEAMVSVAELSYSAMLSPDWFWMVSGAACAVVANAATRPEIKNFSCMVLCVANMRVVIRGKCVARGELESEKHWPSFSKVAAAELGQLACVRSIVHLVCLSNQSLFARHARHVRMLGSKVSDVA